MTTDPRRGLLSAYGRKELRWPGEPATPGARTGHIDDLRSWGTVVSARGDLVTVLWGRQPWWETMWVEVHKIVPQSRRLRVGWTSEATQGMSALLFEEDGPS